MASLITTAATPSVGETKESTAKPLLHAPKWDLERMKSILEYRRKDWENHKYQVEVDDSVPTPLRFINSEKGNPSLARSRWLHTMWYKEEFGLNDLLNIPHPLFDIIDKYYPMAFFGLTSDNKSSITLECFPKLDHETLTKLGIGESEIFFHYLWMTQFGREHILKDGSTYNIVDLDGGSLSMLYSSSKKYQLGNLIGKYFEKHEPESACKIDVINAPGWFNWMVYPLIKLIAKRETLEKVDVFSTSNKRFVNHIQKSLPMEQIPVCYGGNLNESPFEGKYQKISREIAMNVLKEKNLQMFTEEMLIERLKKT
jgi:hypothetical protein